MTNMAKTAHDSQVVNQFGPRAAAYVTSAVHAQGDDLTAIASSLAGTRPANVLDLGCGGGHASFAAAPVAGHVTAYDLSADMLRAVAAEAVRRGIANIATHQGSAEALPFPDASFDAVITRYSAHHWGNAGQGVAEAARVLKPGGIAIFADVVAPEEPKLDTFLQSFEILRDTSHVRDYSIPRWQAMCEAAGLVVDEVERYRVPIAFGPWVERMATPEPFVTAIRALQEAMPEQVRGHFEIAEDGSFVLDSMVMKAHKEADDRVD